MNFTVASHNNAKNPNDFIHYDNVEFTDIPEMITSNFAYCACKLKNNYRKDDNFIGKVDVLIIDVDDNCTIEQALLIFKKYKFFLVTTRSHQISKNNLVCDRFRIVFELDSTVDDRQQLETMYLDFMKIYNFVDKSCKNVSRFFYSSPRDAKVIFNDGKKYSTRIISDSVEAKEIKKTTQSIPKGIYAFNELLNQWINEAGEVLEIENDGIESKLKGAITILDDEFYDGNRNNAIFKVACMLLKDGLSEEDVIEFILDENSKRDSMSFNRTMTCIKSAIKTI